MKLFSTLKAEARSRPIRVVWASLITAVTLGTLWGNFWLGHLLDTHWSMPWTLIVWWTIPFIITTSLSMGLFVNSMSYLFDTLKKEIK